MKKIFLVAGVALLAACTDSTTSSETNVSGNSTTDTATTTNNAIAAPGNDTGATGTNNGSGVTGTETRTTTTTYTASEGDATRRDGKVLVYRSGKWVAIDRDQTNDGVTITRSGSVTRNGKTVEIQEGETVDKSGSFWDKAGNAVSNAWDDTKHGVKKAGQAVGDAAKKVGSKVKDAVDKDDK
ncbi:MAG: hypothetical protein EOO08_03340 [Chitinophagaceae bacterium]|nr:MAG: hypothetical protein EOO08_03340 [Chitinophagaceae bacterium]